MVCGTCNSPDTVLKKEKRVLLKTCAVCGASSGCKSIKSDMFVALVGKRRRIRAKEGITQT